MVDPLHPIQCDFGDTEMDPGKDLFALLFMSFFLIAVLMLISVGRSRGRVPINAAGPPRASTVVLDRALLGRMEPHGRGVELCQGRRCWLLPQQAAEAAAQARFLPRRGGGRLLIVKDPGNRIGAGTMLRAVNALNRLGISVEFRTEVAR